MVVSSLFDWFLLRAFKELAPQPTSHDGHCTGFTASVLASLANFGLSEELVQTIDALLLGNLGLRTADVHGFLQFRELYRLHHAFPLLLELFLTCVEVLAPKLATPQPEEHYFPAPETVALGYVDNSEPPPNATVV